MIIFGGWIGWLDLLRVGICGCAGIMSLKAYKQGERAPLLRPRRAFVPAGCGGYTLLFDIVPHPALLVAGAVSGRRCRLGGGGSCTRPPCTLRVRTRYFGSHALRFRGGVIRRCTGIESRRVSRRALHLATPRCFCGVIELMNACGRSGWLAFVQAGCGY